MPVRIRLAQRGKKKNRTFRVIVADSRSPRDGKFIEDLGYYDPHHNPSMVEIDVDKYSDDPDEMYEQIEEEMEERAHVADASVDGSLQP